MFSTFAEILNEWKRFILKLLPGSEGYTAFPIRGHEWREMFPQYSHIMK